MISNKTILSASLAAALGSAVGVAQATSSVVSSPYSFFGSNFTMLTTGTLGVYTGTTFGGTNDVSGDWDGTAYDSVTDTASNMTLSSSTKFFGAFWTAAGIRVFGPGTYTFDTSCSGPGDGACTGNNASMTVAAGQLGAHMLFNWATNSNIDMLQVWDQNAAWADPTIGDSYNDMFTGKKTTTDAWSGDPTAIWRLTNTDGDANGTLGLAFVDGPFAGKEGSMNLQGAAIPVPAAVWLFGSGLVGLVGVARRKKTTSG